MRAQSVIALLTIASVQLPMAYAVDSDAIGREYTRQATDVARRVVLAEFAKHPERIHPMSVKCTFQLDRQGRPHNVKVVSNTHDRWAEDTARRALADAKYPPIPKSVIQQSGSDLAGLEYKFELGAKQR